MKALLTEQFHNILTKRLLDSNIQCTCIPNIDSEGLIKEIDNYDILIINSKIYIGEEVLNRAKKLKIIGRVGSGLDIVDLEACEKRKIEVVNSPEGNANAVAEHTLGMILSSMNNMYEAHHQIINGEWKREENRGEELYGKTVAIIGCGHVGSRVAELLHNFNVKILVNDIIKKDGNFEQVNLNQVYQEADIVSLHLPLNSETHHFANSDFFNAFRKPIYFVNTSRGKIVNTEALLNSIHKGKVKKAMIDVYEQEPLRKNRQFQAAIDEYKLIATPHIAGWSMRSKYELCNILVDKILSKI